ncbi:MAG: hypothetical protein QM756_45510 [Polyangiaceae bacterium]
MTAPPMTLQRFRELASAYGARLERWPAPERALAEQLLAGSVEARTLLAEEGALDDLLSLATPPDVSADLSRRLAEVPVRNPQATFSLFKRWLWAPLVGWGAAAALGVVLGISFADVEDDTTTTTASADVSAEQSNDDALDALALGDVTNWEDTEP